MIFRPEIEKLAALSRLKLSSEELSRMEGEMAAILTYVDKLKAAAGGESGPVMSVNRNVMRDDANARPGGQYTERLLSLAPERRGEYLKVKKILE